MTGNDNRMALAARIKELAALSGCLLAVFAPGVVMGQTGPVLPSQADRLVSELTPLVVTNTATDTNIPPGEQYSTVLVTKRLTFAYADRNALLADGWSFMAQTGGTNRNTEITNGLVVDYNQSAHPGSINIPCDLGDMWEINNNRVNPTRNFLSRALSPNWTNIDLTITFHSDTDKQEAGIALYQDDDNFVLNSIGYSTIRFSHPDTNTIPWTYNTDLGPREYCVWEYGGQLAQSCCWLNYCPHVHNYWYGYGTLVLRWTRDPSTGIVQPYWSPAPGVFWDIGDPGQLYGYSAPPRVVNPRIGIWTGCAPPATPGAATLVLSALEVISIEPAHALFYSLLNPPAGATIDTNGIITWTPSEAQGPGTNVITTVVTDNSVPPLSDTNSFTVVVAEVNTPPTLPPQPDLTVNVLTPLTVVNTATDTDVPINPLSYQLTVAPTGASIDANGIINWAPGAGQQFTTNLFVTVVTDSNPWAVNAQSLSATNSFTVVVLPPPGPVLPIQASRSVVELTTLVVTNTATDGYPTVPRIGTNTVLFNYTDRAALLADGWSFIGTNGGNARDTEYTAGAGGIDYNQVAHSGILNIPCDQGDLYQTANATRNSLFRSLPSDWQSVRLALTFTPVVANYQQAHLGLYQDDDNYMQMGVAYNSGYGAITHERFTMDLETGGTIATPVQVQTSNTNLYFRLDRNPTNSTVTCYYSYDGASWTPLGATNVTFANPRLMIWTGGLYNRAYANGMAVMGVRRLDIIAGTAVPTVLSYTLINPPAGATIDGNGIITWTPSASQGPATNTITTVVTDNGVPPLSDTNNFTVTVIPWASPTISATYYSGGEFSLTVSGPVGPGYIIQASATLSPANWVSLLTNISPSTPFTWSDPGASTNETRFYRVILAP